MKASDLQSDFLRGLIETKPHGFTFIHDPGPGKTKFAFSKTILPGTITAVMCTDCYVPRDDSATEKQVKAAVASQLTRMNAPDHAAMKPAIFVDENNMSIYAGDMPYAFERCFPDAEALKAASEQLKDSVRGEIAKGMRARYEILHKTWSPNRAKEIVGSDYLPVMRRQAEEDFIAGKEPTIEERFEEAVRTQVEIDNNLDFEAVGISSFLRNRDGLVAENLRRILTSERVEGVTNFEHNWARLEVEDQLMKEVAEKASPELSERRSMHQTLAERFPEGEEPVKVKLEIEGHPDEKPFTVEYVYLLSAVKGYQDGIGYLHFAAQDRDRLREIFGGGRYGDVPVSAISSISYKGKPVYEKDAVPEKAAEPIGREEAPVQETPSLRSMAREALDAARPCGREARSAEREAR